MKGGLAYTTGKNAAESCIGRFLLAVYFGFCFRNCCAKSATDSLGGCLLI